MKTHADRHGMSLCPMDEVRPASPHLPNRKGVVLKREQGSRVLLRWEGDTHDTSLPSDALVRVG